TLSVDCHDLSARCSRRTPTAPVLRRAASGPIDGPPPSRERTVSAPRTCRRRRWDVGVRKEPSQAAQSRKYQMRADLFSIGDDYWIEDEGGNKAFHVDGKAMRIRDTWSLQDTGGHEVACIREKKLSIRDKIKIELGDREATVSKKLLGWGQQFHVE